MLEKELFGENSVDLNDFTDDFGSGCYYIKPSLKVLDFYNNINKEDSENHHNNDDTASTAAKSHAGETSIEAL